MANEANTLEIAIDPICGMKVQPDRAAGTSVHGGRQYYFCSKGCQQKFEADPAKYLAAKPTLANMGGAPMVQIGMSSSKPKPATPAPAGTIYICPMDPEVRESKPGACPICGMALEPEMPSATSDTGDVELKSMTIRFWVCAVLTIPLLISSMAPMMGL